MRGLRLARRLFASLRVCRIAPRTSASASATRRDSDATRRDGSHLALVVDKVRVRGKVRDKIRWSTREGTLGNFREGGEAERHVNQQ